MASAEVKTRLPNRACYNSAIVAENEFSLDPSEVILHRFKRHPIGLLQIFLVTVFIFAIMMVVMTVILSQDFISFPNDKLIIGVLFTVLGSLVVLGGVVAFWVYRQNEMVLTNEKVIQVQQTSLFDRQVSKLNLSKIQDVTARQDNLIQTIFKYGVLTIETAGEAANYNFPYTPRPNDQASRIAEAHEQYIKTHPGHAGGGV